MKIIDAHIHFSNIESFKQTAREISYVNYSGAGLSTECNEADIICAIGMGLTEQKAGGFPDNTSPNPMMLDLELQPPAMVAMCPGINPMLLERDGKRELERIEAVLQRTDVVGIKVYAGYYPYYVCDEIYEPVYRLAEQNNLTIVIHGGATYSDRCFLKYAHPLSVDEVAVMYKKLSFVIAHLGDPWVMDTAAVIAKNENVYADLSGLIVADAQKIGEIRTNRLLMEHFKQGLEYAERYEKVMFGSDWPLAPILPYIDFVKDLIPERYYEDIFYRNALRVFPKLEHFISNLVI